MSTLCTKSVHEVPAHSLVEDDRVLLKDLRVLEVTQLIKEDKDDVTFKWFQLAAQERGAFTVPRGQRVKIICGGRCFISRELDALL